MTAASSVRRELVQVLRDVPRQARDPNRPRMLWRQDLITCMLATWLIQGLTMDAWAHTNQTKLETVVTPWHALFYGGFAVTAAWICFQIRCNIKEGRVGIGAVPIGYGVALIGMGCFFLSGVGDQIWHALFGIERSLEAFLSPTHLLLVIGMTLLVSAPFRAMWSDPRPRNTTFLSLLPAVWSLAPAALWAMYFLVLAIAYNVGWPVELAVGVGAIASMITLILAYVMIPTPIRLISDDSAPVSTAEAPMPAPATAGIDG